MNFQTRVPLLHKVRAFARSSRGGAAVELALGTVALITVSMLCFDLYSRVSADTDVARMAAAMAEYVSREQEPDGGELAALGSLLVRHQLGAPADLVFVVTVLLQPAGDPKPPVHLLWADNSIRIGDTTVTTELAGQCTRYMAPSGRPTLPQDFASAMSEGEGLVVTEVCARLTREGMLTDAFMAGDGDYIYRHHAIPVRDSDRPPTAPVYSQRDTGQVTVLHTERLTPNRTQPAAGVKALVHRSTKAYGEVRPSRGYGFDSKFPLG